MKEDFLEENARDLISLGGIVFFLVVLVRILIIEDFAYLSRFLISGFLLFVLLFFIKANYRAALGMILLVFLSIFYSSTMFTIFAIVIYLLAIASMVYLKDKKMEIFKGIVLGLICTGIGYYLSVVLF